MSSKVALGGSILQAEDDAVLTFLELHATANTQLIHPLAVKLLGHVLTPHEKRHLLCLLPNVPAWLEWRLDNPLCQFVGVFMTDDNLRVAGVRLNGMEVGGVLHLNSLPPCVRHVDLGRNRLSGTIAFGKDLLVFSKLRILNLNENQLSGSLDLTCLPPSLSLLDLSCNSFTGPIDLTKLPTGLTYLSLQRNRLSGTLDLSRLPTPLITLTLSDNCFSGTVDVANVPTGLSSLALSYNSRLSVVGMSKRLDSVVNFIMTQTISTAHRSHQ
jgi:hypothetical protein